MRILAMDVGGTKVHAAIVQDSGAGLELAGGHDAVLTLASQDYSSFAGVFETVLARFGRNMDGVAIGAAGPVMDGCVKVTNLTWDLSVVSVQKSTGCDRVALLNDLEAHAYAVPDLRGSSLSTVNVGRPRAGNRALIAAGTGLGEAILFWDGAAHRPSPSEGGHTDFAPASAKDLDYLAFLFERYEHVSWERVVSGMEGFRNIYEYLRKRKGMSAPPSLDREVHQSPASGALLVEEASRGTPIALAVVKFFVELYGSEAGNLALKAMAVNGVYVGGGIAPHMIPWMEQWFMPAFVAKGRFSEILSAIPVHIIVDPHNALKGAARGLLAQSIKY